MSKLGNIVTFTLGAVVGAAASWYVLNKKYTQQMQYEIDSVKRVYKKKFGEPVEKHDEIEDETNDSTADENYTNDIIDNYKQTAAPYINEDKPKPICHTPYVISPDEFGDIDEYETLTFSYYKDGTVTDDNDDPVLNIDEVIGDESLAHFGEYDDNSVCVRNERLKCDIEILQVLTDYKEKPGITEE